MAKTLITYEGIALKTPIRDEQGNTTIDCYIPDEDLIDVVNLAIQLDRPLLLMGEPGCGKTRLAEAVAYELHRDKMKDHFFRWDIKSTTKAKEGIYHYDALQRLHDANLGEATKDKVAEKRHYISLGEMVKAFTKPDNNGTPNVLLIDEVDKADIDFPNDLLLELDTKQFHIPELGEAGKLKATSKVLIFITSNQEKELPPAFLRRCLYHFIEFPDKEKLEEIVHSHFTSLSDEMVDKALALFNQVRDDLEDTDKKPSTSELLDWFKMIDYYTKRKEEGEQASEAEKRLIAQLELLDTDKIPFAPILLKTRTAQNTINNQDD